MKRKGVAAGLTWLFIILTAALLLACKEPASVKSTRPLEALKAGELAPDFHLSSLSGEPISLSDYRGKVVLLNFWATWCVPCVMEMPALERLSQNFSDKGLVVLGVNLDNLSKREQVKQFTRNYALTFPIALDSSFTVPRHYGVTGFPETFFIDREGRLLKVNDPLKKQETVRFISDRPWDSPLYIEAIAELLK